MEGYCFTLHNCVTMHGTKYTKTCNLFTKLDAEFETQTVTTNVKSIFRRRTAVNRPQWYVLPGSCPGQYPVKNLLYFNLLRQNPRILRKYKPKNLPVVFYESKTLSSCRKKIKHAKKWRYLSIRL